MFRCAEGFDRRDEVLSRRGVSVDKRALFSVACASFDTVRIGAESRNGGEEVISGSMALYVSGGSKTAQDDKPSRTDIVGTNQRPRF